MTEQAYPDLYAFLASEIAEADLAGATDAEAVAACVTPYRARWLRQVAAQGRAALAAADMPWREIARYANRNLQSCEAVAAWLGDILDRLEARLREIEPRG